MFRERLGYLERKGLLLLLSVLLTNIGIGGHTLIMGVLVYGITDSALAFAGTLSVGFAVDLVSQFFGGALLDRANPRTVAVIGNMTRGVLILLAGIGVAFTGSVWPVVLASLYMNLVGPVYRASMFALSPVVVEKAYLPSFNALRWGLIQIGQLLGLGFVSVMLVLTTKEVAYITIGCWFVFGGVATFLMTGLPKREAAIRLTSVRPGTALREWGELFRACR